MADDGFIKRQYRKLALLLHPDKNKSLGAEAAFKLIGEAFGVLSDKVKRAVHDMRRGAKGKVAQVHTRVSETTKPYFPTTFHAQQQAAHQAPPAPGPQTPHPSLTFWTSCPLCRMQYQYLRMYLNFKLLCQKCNEPFLAKEINATAPNGANIYTWTQSGFDPTGQHGHAAPVPPAPPRQEFKYSAHHVRGNGATTANGFADSAHAGIPHNNAAGAATGTKASGAAAAAAAAAANLVQETFQKVRRERVDAEREVKRKEKEKEKTWRQQEKEAQKRAREEVRSREALERLMARQRERDAKRKVAEKPGLKKRSQKRRRKVGEDGEDVDEEELLEQTNSGDFNQADTPGISTRSLTPRRSMRNRRNVTYKIDVSDDDLEEFPASKKSRPDGGCQSGDGVINGEQTEGKEFGNGSRIEKGKSVVHEDGEILINGGYNDCEVSSKDGYMKDGGSGSAHAKDKSKEDLERLLAEKFRRELKAKFRGAKSDGLVGKEFSGFVGGMVGKPVEVNPVEVERKEQKQEGPNAAGVMPEWARPLDKEQVTRSGSPTIDAPVSPPAVEEAPIIVPDPDHHEFDDDRKEDDVKKDQIWAIFDEQDGMPRFYCRISKVITKPFSAHGIWLEAQSSTKQTWLGSHNLSPSTGEFKLGEGIVFDCINMFSHVMTFEKGLNRVLKIFPRVGEVWALYRDFDKELPKRALKGGVEFRYDMVEVKSDFSMVTRGGSVVALERLEGYRTLWKPVGDVYRLSVGRDLQQFSHCVPSYTITEEMIPGVPMNCLELDPASTPAESIQG